jgi:hypothetical protein
MDQAAKITSIITDINLMDWHDDMHYYFEKATYELEFLLMAIYTHDEWIAENEGRDIQQEQADYMASR